MVVLGREAFLSQVLATRTGVLSDQVLAGTSKGRCERIFAPKRLIGIRQGLNVALVALLVRPALLAKMLSVGMLERHLVGNNIK